MNRDYHYVKLRKNNVPTPFAIHRLVAEHFIPNEENKPQVDHISGDKNDNSVWNLRWATQLENMNNPNTTINRLNNPQVSHTVYQYSLDDELEAIFPSLHEAEREGFGRKEIKKCCEGKQKTHKGHKWSYEYIWKDIKKARIGFLAFYFRSLALNQPSLGLVLHH